MVEMTADQVRAQPLQAIEKEIAAQKDRLPSVPRVDRAFALDKLSGLWGFKFEKTRDINDLEEAVRVGQEAVQTMLPDEQDRAAILSHLSAWMGELFGETHSKKDADAAIEFGQLAMEAPLSNNQDGWMPHINMGNLLYDRFIAFGDPRDLDKAMEDQEKLLSMLPEDKKHPAHPTRLDLISRLLVARFTVTGDLAKLEESIRKSHEAILSPCEYSPKQGIRMTNNLATTLYLHYQTSTNLSSLREAIKLSQATADALPGTYERAIPLGNHSLMLVAMYERMREQDLEKAKLFLEHAIECAKEAVELIPDKSPQKAIMCDKVAAWLGMKVKVVGSEKAIKEMLAYSEKAILTIPSGHIRRAAILCNYATSLETVHEILEKKGEHKTAALTLDRAIETANSAVEESKPEDSEFGDRLKNLASLWGIKHRTTKDKDCFVKAKEYFLKAAHAVNAPPLTRVLAAYRAGSCCLDLQDWANADSVLNGALNDVPSISPRSIPPDDQRYVLRSIAGLGARAAVAALEAGWPVGESLRRLEAARCVVSGFSIGAKSDISDLRSSRPDLADRYENLRNQISRSFQFTSTTSAYLPENVGRRTLLSDLSRVEEEIRSIELFKKFQLPLGPDDFMKLASDGPIITFNVLRGRSDAIIVTSDDIKLIHLPDLLYNDLESKVRLFSVCGGRSSRDIVPRYAKGADEDVEKALVWLWDCAIKPVLTKVKLTSSKRIWWVTNGLMGLVPIHAAGHHTPDSAENTLSWCISSYISSFKALHYAREREHLRKAQRDVLLVTMARNPEPYRDLNVTHEEEAVRTAFGENAEVLSHPTPKEVLERLPKFQIVHFACHGLSESSDVSKSGLLLLEDRKASFLTIKDLETADLVNGYVAYLSACSTAELSDGKLVDEATHLANTFQALGFTHVIGTIWGADDKAAGNVALLFYRRLLGQGSGSDQGRLPVAEALHESIKEYRSQLSGQAGIMKWAPFIHIGG